MTVKLNHYFSINPIKSKEYKKFIIKKFIPGVNRLNMHTVAVWSVMVGAYSEIIFESVANDLDLLEKALRDPEYQKLKSDLFNYIKNYQTKVLVKTGTVDAYSTDIREDTVKFNQMWDVISEKQEDYDKFTNGEFYPVLNELGITVAGEWEVLIGDGPRIICEGRATDVHNLIPNLQSRKMHQTLKNLKFYVENYRSRILTFHIQKIKGYKSASYNFVWG
ncbi:MAG: hypothetical protein ABF292_11555 [Desulfobacterales bacterium]